MLSKAIYRFNASPIKKLMTLFTERKQVSIIYVETQKTPNNQNNLENNTVWDITLLDFKVYHKATIIKSYDNGTKTDRSMEQNKKIPEMNARLNGKLIYDKRGK